MSMPAEEIPGQTAAQQLYERFLPPPDFRGIDPSLYEMRHYATPAETLRAWDAAATARRERDAAHAMHFAEDHLRRLTPDLMAHYDNQRAAGVEPHQAMAAARAVLQEAAMEALHEELGIEASERGLVGRARDEWIERQLDDLTPQGSALSGSARAEVTPVEDYRPVADLRPSPLELVSRAEGNLWSELANESTERGLDGQDRQDWIERWNDAFTDVGAYGRQRFDDLIETHRDGLIDLPERPGTAAFARALEYRSIITSLGGLMGEIEERSAMIGHSLLIKEAVDDWRTHRSTTLAELVNHPAPIDGYLGAYAAAGDHLGLCELAEELGHRRDELSNRAQEVLVQEQSVAALLVPPFGPPDAVGIPPAAVAACLASHIAVTGDDVASVGMALGVEPEWVRGVLTGAVPVIDAAHVQAMCVALESSPEELFGPPDEPLGVAPGLTTAVALASPVETSPARQLLDSAGFLRADEMLADVAVMGPDELGDLVRALATRHSQLAAWAEDLAVREELAAAHLQVPRPVPHDFATTGPLPLSAAAAAAQIEILAIDSGEDLDTLAQGLGLEASWVRDVVAGTVDVVDADHARQLCDALELSPASVFGVAGMALEGPDTAWAVVPYDPFDHEVHLELLEPPGPALDLDFGP